MERVLRAALQNIQRSYFRAHAQIKSGGSGYKDWGPLGLGVIVRNGHVHLSGIITNERFREAAMVAAENVSGVAKVHDHLCWVDPMSGLYLQRTGWYRSRSSPYPTPAKDLQ